MLRTLCAVASLLAARGVVLAQKPAEPAGLTRLSPKFPVWLDAENKRVIIVGRVCLREGQMEMFACLRRTKEHESVVAVPTEAYIVHAGLVAAGAEPGNPAQFVPTYQPARGTEIAITVYWSDAEGKRHKLPAQQWLRNIRTNKAMEQPWVFGGSGFWVDPANGQRHYQAEDGDFICVSNFASAMLDVPTESSQSNDALLFEAETDKIPPLKTPVTLVLTPQLKGLPAQRGDDPKTDLLPLPADEDAKPAEAQAQ
ncbi:MAG TPA: YdjY domain-containing protein [Pirellulales bacterium]|jgi:hypothetical protein|nr:YdjY domain-containing protein [Pirellulales bacterium]